MFEAYSKSWIHFMLFGHPDMHFQNGLASNLMSGPLVEFFDQSKQLDDVAIEAMSASYERIAAKVTHENIRVLFQQPFSVLGHPCHGIGCF